MNDVAFLLSSLLEFRYHPDLQGHAGRHADDILAAERKFRAIKDAYDQLLKLHAGYSPPPPGSNASRSWPQSRAAHESGGGPVRSGGPYGGYETEAAFYRSGFRVSRNNPLLLILVGLVAIPAISTLTGLVTGESDWIKRFRDEGIHGWAESKFRVNGKSTVALNPYSIRSVDNMGESCIYKSDKYRHLRPSSSGHGSAGIVPSSLILITSRASHVEASAASSVRSLVAASSIKQDKPKT